MSRRLSIDYSDLVRFFENKHISVFKVQKQNLQRLKLSENLKSDINFKNSFYYLIILTVKFWMIVHVSVWNGFETVYGTLYMSTLVIPYHRKCFLITDILGEATVFSSFSCCLLNVWSPQLCKSASPEIKRLSYSVT